MAEAKAAAEKSQSALYIEAFTKAVIAFGNAVKQEQEATKTKGFLFNLSQVIGEKGSLLLGSNTVTSADLASGMALCDVVLSKVDNEARVKLQEQRLGIQALLDAGFIAKGSEEAEEAEGAIKAFEQASTTFPKAKGAK